MESERLAASATMSFSGSAKRIWRLTTLSENAWARALLLIPAAALLIAPMWLVVAAWYVLVIGLFGLLFLPFRLLTRSRRKRKIEAARHRETLAGQSVTSVD